MGTAPPAAEAWPATRACLGTHAQPRTEAVRQALGEACCTGASAADLLFLEAWEAAPRPEIGITLRVHQIRRANPVLAAAIRAELGRAELGRAGSGGAAPGEHPAVWPAHGPTLDFVLDFG
jgi:hypothetical protein